MKRCFVINNRKGPVTLISMKQSDLLGANGLKIINRTTLRIGPGLTPWTELRTTDGAPVTQEQWDLFTKDGEGAAYVSRRDPLLGCPILEIVDSLSHVPAFRAQQIAQNTVNETVLATWLQNDLPQTLRIVIQDQLIAVRERKARVQGRSPEARRAAL